MLGVCKCSIKAEVLVHAVKSCLDISVVTTVNHAVNGENKEHRPSTRGHLEQGISCV